MTDIVGYLALGLGLFAISKKNMITFRLWHIASAVCYILFGLLLSAIPIITGGVLFFTDPLVQIIQGKIKVEEILDHRAFLARTSSRNYTFDLKEMDACYLKEYVLSIVGLIRM